MYSLWIKEFVGILRICRAVAHRVGQIDPETRRVDSRMEETPTETLETNGTVGI